MTKEEKFILAIMKGIIYEPYTGKIFGIRGKEITKKDKGGYIIFTITINNKTYDIKAHQFAYYWVYQRCVKEIDHINRIRNDNRIVNLRSSTRQTNSFNTDAKGYYYNKAAKKWYAQIKLDYQVRYLGSFDTELEARQTYLNAKDKLHKIK